MTEVLLATLLTVGVLIVLAVWVPCLHGAELLLRYRRQRAEALLSPELVPQSIFKSKQVA